MPTNIKHSVRSRVAIYIGLVILVVASLQDLHGQTNIVKTDPALEAEIVKVIRGYYDAYSRRDLAGTLSAWADDGFVYYSTLSTNLQTKAGFRANLQSPMAVASRDTFEIEDMRVLAVSADTALANYTVISKNEQGGVTDVARDRTSNVLVRRDGRWQIVLDHTSKLAAPVEPVLSGMPVGWRRTPANSSNGYAMTVDSTVKRTGRAAASIKYSCPGDEDFGSIGQEIAADSFRGKRIRLSGWLKTEKAGAAGLWLRVDGVKQTLGFDNMMNRAARNTTEWNQYEVVLDVPAEAVNVVLGSLLYGKGQVWIDDLKLEIVGPNVPSTNQLSPEQMQIENPRTPKRSAVKEVSNLGFENGIVP